MAPSPREYMPMGTPVCFLVFQLFAQKCLLTIPVSRSPFKLGAKAPYPSQLAPSAYSVTRDLPLVAVQALHGIVIIVVGVVGGDVVVVIIFIIITH